MNARNLCPAPAGRNGVGEPHTERTMTARLRGLLALGVCLCLTLALLPAPARAAAPTTNWADNADTTWYSDGPTAFTLTTAAELAGLAVLVNGNNSFSDKTVTLSADVDLSAHLWTPIRSFAGTFDGGGHTIAGMTIDITNSGGLVQGGFFEAITQNAVLTGVRLSAPTIKLTGDTIKCGSLVADGAYSRTCAVRDCVVEQPRFELALSSGSSREIYAGGLTGGDNGSALTVYNSALYGLSMTVTGTVTDGVRNKIDGLGGSFFYNCFVTVDTVTKDAGIPFSYVPGVSDYCYWLPKEGVTDTTTGGTQCYAVTAEQIAGTGTAIIGQASDAYANTPSLLTALNNWVDAQGGAYSAWAVNKQGSIVPSTFIPAYIDIGAPLNDVTHQSATGDIETGMDLEGQVQQSVSLLSVTLPASIPFIVDVEANGAFKRVLSATGNLTNRSDTGVNITLTAVTDDGGLLDKVALSLVPDPAPVGGNVALSAGTGKTDLLATLAAPAAGGAPTTATVKVDGVDKLGGASVGADGAQFTVGLTLKVSNSAPPVEPTPTPTPTSTPTPTPTSTSTPTPTPSNTP